jgi:hypothetical protein
MSFEARARLEDGERRIEVQIEQDLASLKELQQAVDKIEAGVNRDRETLRDFREALAILGRHYLAENGASTASQMSGEPGGT